MKKVLGILVVFLMLLGVGVASASDATSDASEIKKITSKEYYSSLQSKVAIVMFSMDRCKYCAVAEKNFLPELVKVFSGEEKVGVYELNASHDEVASSDKNLVKNLAISKLPTFVILVNGSSVFMREGFPTSDIATQNKIKEDIIKVVEHYK